MCHIFTQLHLSIIYMIILNLNLLLFTITSKKSYKKFTIRLNSLPRPIFYNINLFWVGFVLIQQLNVIDVCWIFTKRIAGKQKWIDFNRNNILLNKKCKNVECKKAEEERRSCRMQNAWIMASCESGQNGVKKLFTKRRPLFSFSELIRHKTDDSDCYNYKFIKIQFKDKTIKPLFKKR